MNSEQKSKILVVDDDQALCNLLDQYLDSQGFLVNCVEDGKSMDAYLKQASADLIILDLMLPGENGLDIIKRLNNRLSPPIIMLSASGEDIDRIIGLEMGADDYLAKPFNPRELLARIRSVLRRQTAPSNSHEQEIYQFGSYQFNRAKQSLLRDSQPVSLTSGDISLLEIFISNPQQVLSRDTLLENLKGYDCAPFDRSIDVRIMRLRQKIEPDTSNPVYIQTIWGEGYKFTPDQTST